MLKYAFVEKQTLFKDHPSSFDLVLDLNMDRSLEDAVDVSASGNSVRVRVRVRLSGDELQAIATLAAEGEGATWRSGRSPAESD